MTWQGRRAESKGTPIEWRGDFGLRMEGSEEYNI